MRQPILDDIEVRPVTEACEVFDVCMFRIAGDIKSEVRNVVVWRERVESVTADECECVLFGGLAESNKILKKDSSFSKDYCIDLCNEVWGDGWR